MVVNGLLSYYCCCTSRIISSLDQSLYLLGLHAVGVYYGVVEPVLCYGQRISQKQSDVVGLAGLGRKHLCFHTYYRDS